MTHKLLSYKTNDFCFPNLDLPDYLYRLMRIADEIIPFDDPVGTDYIWTMQAKYAFLGLSIFSLYARPEISPLDSIQNILKDENEITFALIYYKSRKDATHEIVHALEQITSGSREGQSVAATLRLHLERVLHGI